MRPDAHLSLVNYSYKRLKEGIIRGEFIPGEKLRIAKLKALFKVGPTPIREALSRLSSSGLVQAEENRGFYVKKVSEAEVRDIYSTFIKIEIMALNMAMELGDTNWEAQILAALHKLSVVEKGSAPMDFEIWLQLNYEFHCALIAACNSPCLLKIREDVYQLFDRYCHLGIVINKDFLHLVNKEHCEIAKAVIAREKKKAEKLITAHVDHSLEQVIKGLNKNKEIYA